MSNFYRPEQLLARVWAELNAIKARLRNIDEAGRPRNPGSGTGAPGTPVGGVQTHTHAGAGQGGLITVPPVDAQYLVLTSEPVVLTGERKFVPGVGLKATDGGANGDYTVTVNWPVYISFGSTSKST